MLHLQVACHKNLTVLRTRQGVEPAQGHEFNANKDSVEVLDGFPYPEDIENITDSEFQPPSPPLLETETYPSAGGPQSDYIVEPCHPVA